MDGDLGGQSLSSWESVCKGLRADVCLACSGSHKGGAETEMSRGLRGGRGVRGDGAS